ncbi:MAG: T9SS type A sorting domain-containing protein [Bacteroidia bacterium]|nr:T9SS type A sorting domain-containing protein [Bacteroidia bacterium]
MNLLYRISILALLLAVSHEGMAQQDTVARFLINSAGNFRSEGGVQMDYTIGEIVIETAFGINGRTVLRQGFQQPLDSLNVSVEKPKGIELAYKIFPNPTKDNLWVELKTEESVFLSIEIFDMAGKKTNIPAESFILNGSKRIQFDLSKLPAAFYNLKLMDRKSNEMQSFKIRKIH